MSTIRKMIEDALHAQTSSKAVFGLRVAAPTIRLSHGFFKSPSKLRGEPRLAARSNSTAVVACGGCNNGKVPKRDSEGEKVGNPASWPNHEDCQGLGFRLNRRYGRCGNGRLS